MCLLLPLWLMVSIAVCIMIRPLWLAIPVAAVICCLLLAVLLGLLGLLLGGRFDLELAFALSYFPMALVVAACGGFVGYLLR